MDEVETINILETGHSLKLKNRIISADAYLGLDAIIPALEQGADVTITGRVGDPSLFLAPMVYEFNWERNSWDLLGKGSIVGHLMECSTQITGGYFADPIYKEVEDLEHIGYPIAEVRENGSAIITKLPNTGGLVSVKTCKEQLLYEIGDPRNYLTPDVTVDFSTIQFKEIAPNCVEVTGGSGRERPQKLKVTIGVDEGFIGEGHVIYAGHHALERAQLAHKIIESRLREHFTFERVKFDYVGLNALYDHIGESKNPTPPEVMLRVSGISKDKNTAEQIGNEVETLWMNGPGGPGGTRKYIRPVLGAYSTFLDRSEIESSVILGVV